MDRKAEAKKLLEVEESSLKGKSTGGGATKVTRAQIEETKRLESGATPLPKGVVEEQPLVENPNLLLRQRTLEGHHDAETVDEAIAVLGDERDTVEKHPERRMKAAYAAFEEQELPRLKVENPNLRLSQVKQLVRKEWMKSPDNPMNKPHLTYNEKS